MPRPLPLHSIFPFLLFPVFAHPSVVRHTAERVLSLTIKSSKGPYVNRVSRLSPFPKPRLIFFFLFFPFLDPLLLPFLPHPTLLYIHRYLPIYLSSVYLPTPPRRGTYTWCGAVTPLVSLGM
ncbi:hypothetical protein F4809DRAFT_606768, partial [Biscogniauxia mediterranea]